jgi:hypothetical protein
VQGLNQGASWRIYITEVELTKLNGSFTNHSGHYGPVECRRCNASAANVAATLNIVETKLVELNNAEMNAVEVNSVETNL